MFLQFLKLINLMDLFQEIANLFLLSFELVFLVLVLDIHVVLEGFDLGEEMEVGCALVLELELGFVEELFELRELGFEEVLVGDGGVGFDLVRGGCPSNSMQGNVSS